MPAKARAGRVARQPAIAAVDGAGGHVGRSPVPAGQFRRVLQEAKEETDRFLHSLADLKPSADVDPMAQSLAQEKSVRSPANWPSSNRNPRPWPTSRSMRPRWPKFAIKSTACRCWPTECPIFSGACELLDEAQVVNRRGFWLDIGSGVIAVIFLLGLIAYGYVWVFSPLRKLHQGASALPRRFQLSAQIHPPGRNEGTRRRLQQHDEPLSRNSRRPRPASVRTDQAADPLGAAGRHRFSGGRRRT